MAKLPLKLRSIYTGLLMTLIAIVSACTHNATVKPLAQSATEAKPERYCSPDWYQLVENQLQTGDGQGHGPDLGSGEWRSVVEFKLGLRGKLNLPVQNSDNWCRYIDQALKADPSFSCDEVEEGSIEAIICGDKLLSAWDRRLAEVYDEAIAKAGNEQPPTLKAEQRGWLKGRDECWQADDSYACLLEEYQRRIAELQARYRLVPGDGPIEFQCDQKPAKTVAVTFFQTRPPTLVAEFGDQVAVMYEIYSDIGVRYEGRNELYWGHRDQAQVTWGYQAPKMLCKRAALVNQ